MTSDDDTTDRDGTARARLRRLLGDMVPWDDRERADLSATTAWVSGGAPLWRTAPPDVPPTHLVSYFVVTDRDAGDLLLVAHRKAGLWLPSGGHVEPGEDPWETVRRECREELDLAAVAHPAVGERPFFLTVTGTRGPGTHTDVSLWHVLTADRRAVTRYDPAEFAGIRWVAPAAVRREPLDTLDPQMHRFVDKLTTLGGF